MSHLEIQHLGLFLPWLMVYTVICTYYSPGSGADLCYTQAMHVDCSCVMRDEPQSYMTLTIPTRQATAGCM